MKTQHTNTCLCDACLPEWWDRHPDLKARLRRIDDGTPVLEVHPLNDRYGGVPS